MKQHMGNSKFDSSKDTLEHIRLVNQFMIEFTQELLTRAIKHDQSKLETPEKEFFDKLTPKLASLKYGSEEYKQSLEELMPALEHHYANNSHHPQYYKDGIDGMNLFDIVEMFVDWKAATKRTADGNILESIEINAKRFNISPQLVRILQNTVNCEDPSKQKIQ